MFVWCCCLFSLLLSSSGAAASLTRAGARALRGLCRRRLLTSLEVPIRDPAYPWVMQWLVAKYVCMQAVPSAAAAAVLAAWWCCCCCCCFCCFRCCRCCCWLWGRCGFTQTQAGRAAAATAAAAAAECCGVISGESVRCTSGWRRRTGKTQQETWRRFSTSFPAQVPLPLRNNNSSNNNSSSSKNSSSNSNSSSSRSCGCCCRIAFVLLLRQLCVCSGQHLLRYKGALLLIDRQRSGEVVDFSSGSPWETLTLTTLSLYRHSLQDLVSTLHLPS